MPDYAASSGALALEELALLRHNLGSWSGHTEACLDLAPVHAGGMTLSFLSSHYIQTARFGALSPYVEPYITLVLNKGYKPATIVGQLRLIARLNRWLLRMDYDLGRLDERVLEHFQKCEQKRRRTPSAGARVTLQRFLAVLRDARVAPPAQECSVPPTAVECLAERFRRHLLDDQGLAESTVVNYTWHVQKFLNKRFNSGGLSLSSLQAQDAITFIRHTAHDHSTRHVQLLVAGLRSFFRFLRYEGEIETDLAPALPTVANWPLSNLPKYISAEAVQRVLDECNRETAIGRRNYAVLLLLARLGMRGGEVVRLNLEDIDWHNARIIIRASKGPAWTQLPLTAEVGDAIARYLRHDRPRCDCRRVFVRARAPHVALSHTAAITSLVRRALSKAGIESARKGAHLFRHSLATDMLRRGASLNEIGELLRHQSPNSTAVYAKVELAALRQLAPSWPGGAH